MKILLFNLTIIFIATLIGNFINYPIKFFENIIFYYSLVLKIIASPLIVLTIVNTIAQSSAYNLKSFTKLFTILIIATISASLIALLFWLTFVYYFPAEVTTSLDVNNIVSDPILDFKNNIINFLTHSYMLQLIILAILTGRFLKSKYNDSKILISLLDKLLSFLMMMLGLIVKISPFILAMTIINIISGKKLYMLLSWSKLIIVIISAYIALFIIFALTIKFIIKGSLKNFIINSLEYQIIAFSVGSSKAALPIAMKAAKDNIGVDEKLTNIFLPIISSVNMLGLSIYVIITTLFVAYNQGISFYIGQYIFLIILAIFVPLGVSGIPGGGVTIMPIILKSFGLAIEPNLFLIIAVDQVVNRFRTCVNITGDMVILMLINKLLKGIYEKNIHNSRKS